jgi:hypothetical protein
VRAFGLRTTRYRGLAKTHLQHLATAAALNAYRSNDRLADAEVPRATARRSAFAQLAPRPSPSSPLPPAGPSNLPRSPQGELAIGIHVGG